MISLLSGVALVATSSIFLYAFIPRKGAQIRRRSDWLDASVAVAFTAGLISGVTLFIVGVASVWS
jgi:hypothetical protein